MRNTWYIVIHSLGGWWIDREGRAYGPFDSQEEAIVAGPNFIEIMGEPTHNNQLYAADEHGKFQVVWTDSKGQNDQEEGRTGT
jgi:hypothetical protein